MTLANAVVRRRGKCHSKHRCETERERWLTQTCGVLVKAVEWHSSHGTANAAGHCLARVTDKVRHLPTVRSRGERRLMRAQSLDANAADSHSGPHTSHCTLDRHGGLHGSHSSRFTATARQRTLPHAPKRCAVLHPHCCRG